MSKPQALRDSLKKSDEILNQLNPAEEEEEDQASLLEKHLAEEQEEQEESTPEPTPEPEPEPTPEPSAEPQPDPKLEELERENRRLESAYSVLQGKYNAEVPRLNAQLNELKQQFEASQQKPQEPSPDAEQIKKKLLDTYTPDEVEALETLIQYHAKPKQQAPAIPEDYDEIRQEVRQMKSQTREQLLTSLVPDWKQIESQEYDQWASYLRETVPETGEARDVHLKWALKQGDIERVARFFNDYKHRRDASKKPSEPPPPEPSDAGQAPTPRKPAGKKVWAYSEIQQFEAAVKKGAFNGREAEVRQIRDRIADASVSGRVDWAA